MLSEIHGRHMREGAYRLAIFGFECERAAERLFCEGVIGDVAGFARLLNVCGAESIVTEGIIGVARDLPLPEFDGPVGPVVTMRGRGSEALLRRGSIRAIRDRGEHRDGRDRGDRAASKPSARAATHETTAADSWWCRFL